MKNVWPQLKLLLLGAVPLIPGYAWMRWSPLLPGSTFLLGVLVGAATLLFFYLVARGAARTMPGVKPTLLLNVFGLVMFALLCVQLVQTGAYRADLLGQLPQWFFAPVCCISKYMLVRGAADVYVWMPASAAWFLHVLLSILGSGLRLRRSR